MAEIFVDFDNGDDGNAGTYAAPIKTTSQADTLLDAIGASVQTVIYFKAGQTHTMNAPITATGRSNLTITRYGEGADPIIDNVETAKPYAGFSFTNSTNFLFQSVVVKAVRMDLSECFAFAGSTTNVEFHDMKFYNGSHAIWENGSSGTGNLIHRCAFYRQWTDGVSTNGAAFEVSYCSFYYIGIGNVAAGAGDALTSHDVGTIDCHHSFFYGNKRGAFFHINTSGTNYFWNNRVVAENVASVGVQWSLDTPGGGSTQIFNCGIIIYGNSGTSLNINVDFQGTISVNHTTVYNLNESANSVNFSVVQSGGTGDTTISVNSCISFVRGGSSHTILLGTSPVYSGDNNVFYEDGSTLWNLGTFANWQSATSEDANSVVGNPLFVRPSTNDVNTLMIAEASVARAIGHDATSEYRDDLMGRRRPAASDAGCFQYHPRKVIGGPALADVS